MDHIIPPSGYGEEPKSPMARISEELEERRERSNQLCVDFSDFCETIGHEMEQLHAVYEALPAASVRETLAVVDELVCRVGDNCTAGRASAGDFLRQIKAPGAEVRFASELALQANLRTLPSFVQQAQVLERVLDSTVKDAHRFLKDAEGSRKISYTNWIAAVESAQLALRNEIDSINASLLIAQGEQPQR